MHLDEPTLPPCQVAGVSLEVPGLMFALCGEDSFLGKANDQKEIRDGTSGVVPSPEVLHSLF